MSAVYVAFLLEMFTMSGFVRRHRCGDLFVFPDDNPHEYLESSGHSCLRRQDCAISPLRDGTYVFRCESVSGATDVMALAVIPASCIMMLFG